jgi:hypothetical protein
MASELESELIAYVSIELEDAAEADGEVAGDVVATVIDRVIKALRADLRIPARNLMDCRWLKAGLRSYGLGSALIA